MFLLAERAARIPQAGAAVRAARPAWHDRTVRKDEGTATTSAELRAHNLARLLRAIHDGGGQLTRAELTRQLSLARGTATVLVRDLAGRRLIEELSGMADATVQRTRGRPTGVPSSHPVGPVALAVDLRDDSYTVAAFELTGRCTVLDRQERDAGSGVGVLADVAVNAPASDVFRSGRRVQQPRQLERLHRSRDAANLL